MKSTPLRYATALILLALLASCSLLNDESNGNDLDNELAGTTWQLVSFSSVNADGAPGEAVGSDSLVGRYTLDFASDSTLTAQADCNACGGYYEAKRGGAFSATMACTRAACNRSSEFSAAVYAADRYEIAQSLLHIFYTDLVSEEMRVLIFEPLEEGGTAEIGIVFGQSIEGVMLGIDSTDVIHRLGKPSSFVRGDFPSVTYRYQDSLKGAEFEISTDPSLGDGVISACVYTPYEGKTQQGLGIGAPRGEVHDVLGPPDNPLASAWNYNPEEHERPQGWYDRYQFGEIQFRIEYRSDKNIHSICIEPLLEASGEKTITNATGTVRKRAGDPSFVIEADFSKGNLLGVNMPTWVTPPGNRIPDSFKENGLRIVFSGRALDVPDHVRLSASPLRLVSIEKLN